MEKPLEAALRRAITLLEQRGYRYAVIGGIANQFWGIVRVTQDVDIKVLVPDTDYATARQAIRAAFPERGRPDVPANPLIVDTKAGNIIVDFLLAAPGYEENIVSRAVRREIGGLSLWICSAEDLLIQKAVANRPKDWQDIEGILAEQHDQLDYGYIEDWLQQFADAFEQPEILKQYREIRERIAAVLAPHAREGHRISRDPSSS